MPGAPLAADSLAAPVARVAPQWAVDLDAVPIPGYRFAVTGCAEDTHRSGLPRNLIQLLPRAARRPSVGCETTSGCQGVADRGLWRQVDRPQVLVFGRCVGYHAPF